MRRSEFLRRLGLAVLGGSMVGWTRSVEGSLFYREPELVQPEQTWPLPSDVDETAWGYVGPVTRLVHEWVPAMQKIAPGLWIDPPGASARKGGRFIWIEAGESLHPIGPAFQVWTEGVL